MSKIQDIYLQKERLFHTAVLETAAYLIERVGTLSSKVGTLIYHRSIFLVRGAPMRKVIVLSHGVNNANPSFCARKNVRKGEAFTWFPNLLLLKAALSWLDFGPAYYNDLVSRASSSPSVFLWFLCRHISWSFSFSALTRSDSLTRFPWIRWQRSISLKNGTTVVCRQARSNVGCNTLEF
jgi:hypothetical protein